MSDPMHITQNNAGFDIESVVRTLVQARSQPINRLQQQNKELQDKVSAWNDVDSKISDLSSKIDTVTGYEMWQQNNAEVTNSSTAQDFMSATAESDAAAGSYKFDVTTLAQSQKIASASAAAITGNTDADSSTDLGLEGAFTIGGEEININTGDSLNNIAGSINNAAENMAEDEKVEANIIDNRLVIKRAETGDTSISISESPDSGADEPVLDSGGLDLWDSTNGFHNEIQAGEDLQMTVDGLSVTRSTNKDITDVIKGVTLNFSNTGTADLEVGPDIDSMKSNIEDFISAYNEAMSEAESKSSVDVSEDEVKTSILSNSTLLRSFQDRSRALVTGTASDLNSDFDTLSDIGIGTTGPSNRLSITDSEKLEDALNNNVDSVETLFRDPDNGVVEKLGEYVDRVSQAGGQIDDRLNTINNKIDSNDDSIAAKQRRLESYEEQLWEEYSRVDSIIGQMQQQTDYVNSMISRG